MKKITPSFWPGILWLTLVTILLVLPGSAFPKENWLSKIWFDKWVHIGLFAVMVVLWAWAALRFNIATSGLKKLFVLICLLFFIYGVGMEFVQKYWVSNRSFDAGDIVADGMGCIAGLVFSARRYIKK